MHKYLVTVNYPPYRGEPTSITKVIEASSLTTALQFVTDDHMSGDAWMSFTPRPVSITAALKTSH